MKRLVLTAVATLISSSVLAQTTIRPPTPDQPPAVPFVAGTVPPQPRLDVQPRATAPLPMPGFGSSLSGDVNALKAQTIRVTPGQNEVVNVSMVQANRVGTPFAAPKAVGIIPEGMIVEAVGQSLYIQMPSTSTDPQSLFVTGSRPNDPVISLILVPQAIPSQTAILQFDVPEPGLQPDQNNEPDNYQQRLIQMMRQAAVNQVPVGMSEAALPRAVGRRGPLLIRPEMRYSSATMDQWRYRVESISDEEIELDEAAFWERGVRAVAILPSTRLRKGDHAYVYVISDKTAFQNGAR
ncbi:MULTISPECIES: TraK domain-containing protein [Betaproteobacteria]|uniref:Transfer protein traK n=1 Tax=Aromatoleum aromaticum (strain DSM 19018 / LMG 30748 / EbN1) TaxID=76114 RepID=Q5NX51_AROAE|nr:type-F conjugative transfer system secretin TraK [Aromatoleum aromaticum]MDD3531592.1 type-F conjugative transfer system secretin TraK [Candidatus Paceibacterota bacterium]CAI10363.1 putative transfer protein traK [Aromatoleum aromaticum EbN1]